LVLLVEADVDVDVEGLLGSGSVGTHLILFIIIDIHHQTTDTTTKTL
jgi:hypothetical protein